MSAEKCARSTVNRGLACRHTCTTSKAMFSPSKSQSSHSRSTLQPRASSCSVCATFSMSFFTVLVTGAVKRSSGLQPLHMRYSFLNSSSIM